MSYLATESFTTSYRGDTVEILAGVTSVSDDHELVKAHPQRFRHVPEEDVQGMRYTSLDRSGEPAPRLSLEQELRVRRERLAELERREREYVPAEARDTFWSGVERLLQDPEEAREDAESMRLLDEIDTVRAETLETERESISEWLKP